MAEHTQRKPGHLYVLLLKEKYSHNEEFIEVEDHEGRSVGHVQSYIDGYRHLEFPDPKAHAELLAELEELSHWFEEEAHDAHPQDLDRHNDAIEQLNSIEAAIAKAKGGE